MFLFRRLIRAAAPFALGILCTGHCFATTMNGTTQVFANLPSLMPGSTTISISQWNEAAVNSAIQSGCSSADICSGLTLVEIDEYMTANTVDSITFSNSSGSTQYVRSLSGLGGTYAGGATSGIAAQESATATLGDSFNAGLVTASTVYSAATDTRRTLVNCGTGSPTVVNYSNCLSVANGGRTLSGTASGSGSGSYLSSAGNWSSIASAYTGTGTLSLTLTLTSSEANGTPLGGVSLSSSSAALAVLTHGVEVDYKYTYDDSPAPVAPEPGTAWMGGGSLALLGILHRRYRRTLSTAL